MASARQALADALERGDEIAAGPGAMAVAMRDALRDVAALAARWRAGVSDVGPAAAAEVMDAISGDIPRAMDAPGQVLEIRIDGGGGTTWQQPAYVLDEDAPWRGGGEVPYG